jgi:uncharacterized membrane protein YqaE (UPF0057 family)
VLELLLILIVLAILLPALGVALEPNLMRVAAVIIAVVLIVWIINGHGLLLH